MIPMASRDFTVRDYIPGQPVPLLIRDPATGRAQVNPLRKYVEPYTLSIEPETLTLGAGLVSNMIPMTLDAKGHFEIVDAFFQSSQPEGFTVELFLANDAIGPTSFAYRPFLMNREVHVATIASGGGFLLNWESLTADSSDGGRPYRWPETYFLNVDDGAKVIFARFRNLSASSNTIRFALHGLRWYHVQAPTKIADRIQEIGRGRARSFPYFYTTDRFVELGAGEEGVEETVRFDDVSWTEVFKMTRVSTGRFKVRISELSTQKKFMDEKIRDDLVFGSGELPFLLWEPNLYEPNYSLLFELDDLLDDSNTIWITLGCRKILMDPRDGRLMKPGQASGGY